MRITFRNNCPGANSRLIQRSLTTVIRNGLIYSIDLQVSSRPLRTKPAANGRAYEASASSQAATDASRRKIDETNDGPIPPEPRSPEIVRAPKKKKASSKPKLN
jgi:hypothetical protein